MIVQFNKPFRVLSQFTTSDGKATLADYIDLPGIYCAGRLDYDSEGLLVLTDDGRLQQRIANPRFGKRKGYWVQVEGIPDEAALAALRNGVELKDGRTRPVSASLIEAPAIWPRDPPIRMRKSVADCWLDLELAEGRNRQVRRMTAAVGHPTLRLVRYRVGDWQLGDLQPGRYRIVQDTAPAHGRELPRPVSRRRS